MTSISKEDLREIGFRCILYGDLYTTYDFFIDKVNKFVDKKISKQSQHIKKGDVLFAGSGETIEEIGKAATYISMERAFAGGDVIIFTPYNQVYPESLSYLLESDFVRKQKRRLGQGHSVVHIYPKDLAKLMIPLPPLPEQRAIAACLSTWDEAISKTNELIAQKELRKKWLMQKLLTGKMRLKGFSRVWIETRILHLFKPEKRYVQWNEEELYSLISIRRRNGGVFLRVPLFGNQIGVKKLKEVIENDFVISKRQVSHGAWAIIDPVFNHTKVSDEYDCLIIKNKSLLLPDFWKWFCQLPILSHFANIDSDGVHIEKSIFDFNLFKRRKVALPPTIEEQTAIARVLQAADKEIQMLKAKCEKLKEQKKGLMQILLTGIRRLKV